VHKLKNKLGTKAVPTAELELIDSTAELIGEANQGVKVISTILNITRIHNAVNAVGIMRRAIAIARDYCHRRQVFGKLLADQSLHLATIADLEIEFRSALHFVYDVIVMQGKIECGVSNKKEETVFRIVTPLLKLYTGKQAIAVTSECIESLGGTGYMEDTDMPRLFRDAQILSIWEGTTNVLSLDVWRPIQKEGALQVLMDSITERLGKVKNPKLEKAVKSLSEAQDKIMQFAEKCMIAAEQELIEAHARQFAFSVSRIYMGMLLVEHAGWSTNDLDIEIATRWCTEKPLVQISVGDNDAKYRQLSKMIALDIDPSTKLPRGSGNIDPNGKPRARL